jgi:hypothetical protein
MGKQIMERKASDNKYLHKDFHLHLNLGIEYLHQHYGEAAVREYLKQFARAYYAPLKQELKEKGLTAVLEHNRNIYTLEEAIDDVEFSINENELMIRVKKCPGVSHIRKSGMQLSPLYCELTRTVNEVLCEGTSYAFELLNYDSDTGASVQRFYRKGDV